MRIIDLHCDTILSCYLKNHSLADCHGHISIKKLMDGASLAQCFALFIPTHETAVQYFGIEREPWELYKTLLTCYQENLSSCADFLRPALTADDIRQNRENGFLSSILTVEDGVELAGKPERLREMYKDGVRMMALTWNYENCIGFPNSDDWESHTKKGLKPFGFQALEIMNDLGIIIDVSHLSEAGFYDVAAHSRKPFAASHSCCRALKDHPRNLTDQQLSILADHGGIIGVNFYDQFLGESNGYTSVDAILRHILHIRDKAGIDSIAFGSDMDGITSQLEFRDYSGFPQILSALETLFTDDEIDKICHDNFLRVFRAQ